MRLFMQSRTTGTEAPRYYQIGLQQDLLGGWTLTREWGQQGGRVSVKREVYLERDDALNAFEQARDAQIRRGYETSMAEKLAHDLEWIADRSVRLYLRTLWATATRLLRQLF